jgi:hypothetical protein
MNIKTIAYASLFLILLIVSLEVIPSMLSESDSLTNLAAIPAAGLFAYLLIKLFKRIKK